MPKKLRFEPIDHLVYREEHKGKTPPLDTWILYNHCGFTSTTDTRSILAPSFNSIISKGA